MTGPDHFRKAEELLEIAAEQDGYGSKAEQYFISKAQVHATLALAAATALQSPGGEGSGFYVEDYEAWHAAASAHEFRESSNV